MIIRNFHKRVVRSVGLTVSMDANRKRPQVFLGLILLSRVSPSTSTNVDITTFVDAFYFAVIRCVLKLFDTKFAPEYS